MKDYNKIIDSVIKELLPEFVEKYLPNVKYTNKQNIDEIVKKKINFIYYEYRNNKLDYIIDRIHQLSGKDKNLIKRDYDEIKNDHFMFKNKIKNEIILYLKNNR